MSPAHVTIVINTLNGQSGSISAAANWCTVATWSSGTSVNVCNSGSASVSVASSDVASALSSANSQCGGGDGAFQIFELSIKDGMKCLEETDDIQIGWLQHPDQGRQLLGSRGEMGILTFYQQ